MIIRWDLIAAGGIDPELRFCLAQSALGTLESEIQFLRVQPHQLLHDFDFLADFHKNVPDNAGTLAADPGLIGGNQRP